MNEVTKIIEESGVEKTEAQKINEKFTEFFAQASEWETKVKGLVITDVKQVEEMKLAREGRLQLRQIRVAAEKTKKKLKENVLIKGRLIDGIYNAVVAVTKPLEDDLLEKENFIKRLEEKEKELLKEQRVNELTKYNVDISLYDLANMQEDKYQGLLDNSHVLYEARVEAEKKIKSQRIENERKQALNAKRLLKTSRLADYIDNYDFLEFGEMADNDYEELVNAAMDIRSIHESKQEEIRLENEKLKQEAIEREKKILEEKKIAEEKRQKEQFEREEAEKKGMEKVAAMKKIADDQLRKENERIAEEQRVNLEKAAKIERERVAKEQAPEKEKLLMLAQDIDSIVIPEITDEALKVIVEKAKKTLLKLSFDIKLHIK